MGDSQIEPGVAVEVAARDARSRGVAAARASREAGELSLLGEPEASLVVEKEVGRPVVGHEDVDLAIVVEVGGHDAQATAFVVHDARLPGHVDELPGIVAKHVIGYSRELARVGGRVAGPGRIMVERRACRIPFQIMANVEIQIAVVIEVGPRCPGGIFARPPKTRSRRDVLESTLAKVAIKGVCAQRVTNRSLRPSLS